MPGIAIIVIVAIAASAVAAAVAVVAGNAVDAPAQTGHAGDEQGLQTGKKVTLSLNENLALKENS